MSVDREMSTVKFLKFFCEKSFLQRSDGQEDGLLQLCSLDFWHNFGFRPVLKFLEEEVGSIPHSLQPFSSWAVIARVPTSAGFWAVGT